MALFAPSLGYALTFDDLGTVVEHPGVQAHGLSLRDVFFRDWWGRSFGDAEGVPTYRPLVTLTFWVNQRLGGLFHATNVALYGALLFVVHRFLRVWAADAMNATSRLLTVAAFAALAIHADVVPSVTGRGEILTMLFATLALHAALRDRIVAAAAAIVCAILCKESAMPMVLAIPFLAFRWGVPRKRVAVLSGIAVVAVLAMVLFRMRVGLPFRATHVGVEEGNPLYLAAFGERLPGAMEILARYGAHSAAGIDLCADYSYAELVPVTRWRTAWPFIGAILIVLAVVVVVRTWRRNPRVADALLAFAASYVVVSQVLSPATASLADRLFFTPSFWVLTALGLAVGRARIAVPIGVAFIALQAVLASLSMRMWRDERSLALHTVATCPHNGRGREMRAHVAYLDRDVELTAWQLIARAALYNQFPAAVPDEELSAEWETVPFAQRLELLRKSRPQRYRDALVRGLYLARSGGYREAEAVIVLAMASGR
jgi:protein O-mannosyl-transferase